MVPCRRTLGRIGLRTAAVVAKARRPATDMPCCRSPDDGLGPRTLRQRTASEAALDDEVKRVTAKVVPADVLAGWLPRPRLSATDRGQVFRP